MTYPNSDEDIYGVTPPRSPTKANRSTTKPSSSPKRDSVQEAENANPNPSAIVTPSNENIPQVRSTSVTFDEHALANATNKINQRKRDREAKRQAEEGKVVLDRQTSKRASS